METSSTDRDAFLAIARTIHDSGGFDEWNMRFQAPVLRDVYHLSITQLDDETCRAHALPTWAAIAEAEQQSARAHHPAPALGTGGSPEPWTKTTGEPL